MPDIRIFPISEPQHATKAMISKGAICTDGSTRLTDGGTSSGWCAIARSLHGSIGVMSWPKLSQHKLMSLSQVPESTPTTLLKCRSSWKPARFLSPFCTGAREAHAGVFYDSKHAAGVCLSTTLGRTHVQLRLFCQQSVLKMQHMLRFTI